MTTKISIAALGTLAIAGAGWSLTQSPEPQPASPLAEIPLAASEIAFDKAALTAAQMQVLSRPSSFQSLGTTVTRSRPLLAGVNISGGEFGVLSGRLGYGYTYPSRSEVDQFAALGFKLIRIPFKWERLQPELYGPLDGTNRQALKSITEYATQRGLIVVLDMHNYGRRHIGSTSHLIGSASVGQPALSNAWTRIADDYRGNDKVWIGLMNEPNAQTVADWWRTAQLVVTDLRQQKINNKLLVPGTKWTGAHSWSSSGNAAEAIKLVDPIRNTAFEVHQYLDRDSSGTNLACTVNAASRVDGILKWASTNRVDLFFGEIGGTRDPQCQTEYPAMLRKLNASPQVIAWAAWGAGKWWKSDYLFRMADDPAGPTPHLAMAKANLPQ